MTELLAFIASYGDGTQAADCIGAARLRLETGQRRDGGQVAPGAVMGTRLRFEIAGSGLWPAPICRCTGTTIFNMSQ